MSPTATATRYRKSTRVRALPDVGEGAVEAYVSVYGVPYKVDYWGREQIEPGAFDDSIATKPQLPIFWMHSWDEGLLIGDGTASSDDKGVKLSGQLYIDDELGLRAWRALSSGAIDEWSIAYIVLMTELDGKETDLEHVTKGRLIEASAVVMGANPDTETIEVRKRSLMLPVLEGRKLSWVRAAEFGTDETPPPDADPPAPAAPPANDPPESSTTDEPQDVDWSSLMGRPAVREMLRSRVNS